MMTMLIGAIVLSDTVRLDDTGLFVSGTYRQLATCP
jgi:hypothetical protein